MELLTEAVKALREGVITPFAFVALLFLGLIIWLAAKFGDRLFKNIGGLLDAGEQMRDSLAKQVRDSDARALQFQQAQDLALQRLALAQGDLATTQLERQTMQIRHQAELQRLMDQVQTLQRRLIDQQVDGDDT